MVLIGFVKSLLILFSSEVESVRPLLPIISERARLSLLAVAGNRLSVTLVRFVSFF